jgi:O-antigen/teichoic acid export membrane protein
LNTIKGLAGQTAVYGLSSILGRLLNYLLVPLYSRVFLPHEAAVYVEMYAYVAFFIVILTYGMETAFFRNYQTSTNKKTVFSTTLWSLIFSSVIFIIAGWIFSQNIAGLLRYPDHPEYIIYFAFILGFDAVCSIPFAKLRADNKALRFALIRIISISINIGLNLAFILWFPLLFNTTENETLLAFVSHFTNGKADISAIFMANLIASAVTLLLLFPEMFKAGFSIDRSLWKSMLKYGFPLLIFGLAGIANETIDRILLKYLLPQDIAMHELGVYGMCFKISIFISIFIQAFRYAAEPFFFARANDKDAPKTYATVMHYFALILITIFLGIMLYIDIVKYFVGVNYYEGLSVVPVLLFSHIFLGIFYNLSVWYKITDKTRYGAWFSIAGMVVSLTLNLTLIPILGYMGSAWANFACYFAMMLLSYFYGQKHYPVPYKILKFLMYLILSLILYAASIIMVFDSSLVQMAFNSSLFFGFLFIVIISEPELRKFLTRNNQKHA